MKTLLLLITLLVVTTMLPAQVKPFRYGIKAGLNLSEFKASLLPPEMVKTKNDNGFYAGAQFEIHVSKNFSVQPEIFYIQSRVQDYFVTNIPITTEHLDHISVPLMAKLNVGHLSLFAGPQLSFLLSAKEEYQSSTGTYPDFQSTTVKTDFTDSSYKKAGFSGVAGLGFTFGQKFGIDARYQFGFGNIRASNGATYLTYKDGQDIKLGGFQAGLYYFFNRKTSRQSK